MGEHRGPVYEVTLRVAKDAADGLDDWLAAHARKLLEQPGFVDAEICVQDDKPGYVTRVVRYFVTSDEALDTYLAGPAIALQQQTVDRFGEGLEATRRTLRDCGQPDAQPSEHCLNCGATLTGQYCGQCGQRAQNRLISVFELVKDAFGDLVDADSRLWLTLRQLALRPGLLTREYLQGRRARYMPPFRSYLVFSLLFFAVAFFDPRAEFGILFEPAVDEPAPPDTEPPDNVVTSGDADLDTFFGFGTDGKGNSCNTDGYDPSELSPWLARRLTKERVEAMCHRLTADAQDGMRGFIDKMVEYVPIALFVLLPVMALVLKMLYPLSRRYYVEHLLLLLHFHAFAFLALTVQVLLARTGTALGALNGVTELANVILGFYIPVYFYKTLRRVYSQGHLWTTPKFLVLALCYVTGLCLMLFTAALLAVFAGSS